MNGKQHSLCTTAKVQDVVHLELRPTSRLIKIKLITWNRRYLAVYRLCYHSHAPFDERTCVRNKKIWVLRVSNPVIWATPRDNPRRPERDSEHYVYWVNALQPRRDLVRRRLTPEDASPRGSTYELPAP